MTTANIKLVRIYSCRNVLGAVYTIDGARCSMLIGKGQGHCVWVNGRFELIDNALIAKRLGLALAVVTADMAAKALQAAGLRVKMWAQPKSSKVRVYVAEGGKDRGYLEFDGRGWNIDGIDRRGNAKHFAGIAGIAA
jgi:hypothetical protein